MESISHRSNIFSFKNKRYLSLMNIFGMNFLAMYLLVFSMNKLFILFLVHCDFLFMCCMVLLLID